MLSWAHIRKQGNVQVCTFSQCDPIDTHVVWIYSLPDTDDLWRIRSRLRLKTLLQKEELHRISILSFNTNIRIKYIFFLFAICLCLFNPCPSFWHVYDRRLIILTQCFWLYSISIHSFIKIFLSRCFQGIAEMLNLEKG